MRYPALAACAFLAGTGCPGGLPDSMASAPVTLLGVSDRRVPTSTAPAGTAVR